MKHILLALFIIIHISVFSQNLIDNGGFESGQTESNIAECWCHPGSSFLFLDIWQSRTKPSSKNLDCFEGSFLYRHSPDWFTNYNGQCRKQSYTGDHCVGATEYELFCQKIPKSKIIANQKYLLEFYIQLPVTYLCGGENAFSQGHVDIYLSKSQIKYKDDEVHCSEDYKKYKSGAKVLVGSVYISDIPTMGQYYKAMLEVDFPSKNYNWITFDVHPQNEASTFNCDRTYYLFDNVSLVPGCLNGCSGTAGENNVSFNQIHSPEIPFMITGLGNMKYVELKIFQSNNLVYYIEVYNPPSVIAWDGKSNGTETSAGTYTFDLKCSNDCGTYTYNEKRFYKRNGPYEQTLNHPFTNLYEVSKPPMKCCSAEPDLYLHHIIFRQDQHLALLPEDNPPLHYKAIRSITAGPQAIVANIPTDNRVVFEAGEYIDLMPGFETQPGCEFIARIAPCDAQNEVILLKSINNFIDINSTEDEEYDIDEFSANIEQILVIPNPFQFVYSIISQNNEIDIKNVRVFNSHGQIVYVNSNIRYPSVEIDASKWPSGIYFAKVYLSNNEISSVKLVKNKL